jgi:hypothetical protein
VAQGAGWRNKNGGKTMPPHPHLHAPPQEASLEPPLPATSADDDDHQAAYDGWKFYDGPLDGEPALDDERFGHDTARSSLEIVDGSLSQTSHFTRGVS